MTDLYLNVKLLGETQSSNGLKLTKTSWDSISQFSLVLILNSNF